MPTQVQFRRGTSTQNDAFTGANGEITVDLSNKTLRLHDGVNAGGTKLSNTNNAQFSGNTQFTGNVVINRSLTVGAPLYANNLTVNGHIDVGNTADFYDLATFHGNMQVNGHFDVGNTADFYNLATFHDNVTIQGNTIVDAAFTVTNTVVVEKNLRVNNDGGYFIHVGNSTVNTVIRPGNIYLNGSSLVVGNGASNTTITDGTITIGTTVINATTISVAGTPINSTSFSGTANNASSLGGIPAANYALLTGANFTGDVSVNGNLTVTGSVVSLNTNTLDVKDLNITVAKGAANPAAADGAGLTVDGANATFSYNSATNTFNLSHYVKIGNSTVNSTINSTAFTGDSATVGGNTASTLRGYSDSVGATAYSNAVSYVDTKIGTANAAITGNAATAYSNATSYTDTKIGTANAAITGNAATAYTNATSYTDTKIATANLAITGNAATSYSNAVSYVDTKIGTANAAITGNAATAYSNATAYADTKDATTYSNAVSYTDTKIGTANLAITGNAATAYSNATAYTDTKIATANLAITGNAATAYSNAVTYTDTKIATANLAITGNAATAYSNATAYTDTKIGTANAAITGNAATAYSNATAYTDTKIGTANLAITGNAATAYTNAIAYAASNTYVNNTFAPLAGATFTGAVIVSNNLTVTGNLSLTGNNILVGANNLIVQDAVISLHTLANLAPLTSDDGKLVGTAFHYYNGADSQALLAMNQSTRRLVYWANSTDASIADPTGTTLGTIQSLDHWFGNDTVYSTVNATTFTGTANNATNLNGQAAAYYTNATNITTGTLPWGQAPMGTANTSAQLTWSNTQTFSNTITFSQTIVGTVNNALNLGGTAAASYQLNSTLNANIAAYLPTYTGVVNGSSHTDGTYGSAAGGLSANATVLAIGNSSVNATVNSSVFSGTALTANNATNLGGTAAASYQLNSTLNANIASYLPTYTGVVNASSYTVGTYGSATSGLVGNSTVLAIGNSSVNAIVNSTVFSGTANNATNLGGTAAASYQLNSTLNANIAAYLPTYTGVVNASSHTVGTYGSATGGLSANATVLAIGNSSVFATVNATTFTGTALTANNATNLGGQAAAYYTNATNISTGTLAWAQAPTNTVNTSGAFTFTGVETFNANVVLGAGLSANGGYGTAGQVLTSNGTATYWAAAAAGVNTAAQYTWSNTQTFSNTITFSSTIVGTVNNALNLGGTAASGYQTTAGLSANVATLTSNNSTYLNGQLASYYLNATNITTGTLAWAQAPTNTVNTSGSFTITGVYTHNANVSITGTTKMTGVVDTASANVLNQTLTDGATVSWDASLGQVATLTLGGNRTVANPTNLKVATYVLHVIQDATGSRTITWGTAYKWPGGVAPVLSTGASKRDVISFISDGTSLYGSYLNDVR